MLGSILRLNDELDRDGVRTRAFTSASNRSWGARPFSLGHLRLVLNNPIYRGEILRKGERFKAQLPAIVTTQTLDAVQALLAGSKRGRRLQTGATEANLLADPIVDAEGRAFRSDHAKKTSRRCRYYVGNTSGEERQRIPGGEIEPLVIQNLAALLCDRAGLMTKLLPGDASPELIEHLGREAAVLAAELRHRERSRQRAALLGLIERIVLRRDGLAITFKSDAFGSAATSDEADDASQPTSVIIEIPARFVARGQKLHLVMPPQAGTEPGKRLDKSFIKALARAVAWYDDLVSGKAGSMREIAEQEKVRERYVAQLLPLALLKPALVEAALDGTGSLTISGAEIAKGSWCRWNGRSRVGCSKSEERRLHLARKRTAVPGHDE